MNANYDVLSSIFNYDTEVLILH